MARRHNGEKRTELERQSDQLKIVEMMYVDGKPQYEILKEIDISYPTFAIHRDKILEEWKKDQNKKFDKYIQKSLNTLDRLEAAAWEQYERSCDDYKETSTKEIAGLEAETTIKKKAQTGNPAYLEHIRKIALDRAALLGFSEKERSSIIIPDGNCSVTVKFGKNEQTD